MMTRLSALLFVMMLAPAAAAAAAGATRIAVLATHLEGEAKDEVPSLIDDYVLTAVQELGRFEVVGPDDVNAMLGFEKQKELLGCDEVSCMADIAGALGVDKIVVFKVARLDDEWVTTAKLIDVQRNRVEKRTTKMVPGSAKDLLRAIPSVVGGLFGDEPAPTEPEKPTEPTAATSSPATDPAAAPPDASAPLYTRWWLWAGIGAVVVAGVVTAVILTGGSEKSTTVAPVPTTDTALFTF